MPNNRSGKPNLAREPSSTTDTQERRRIGRVVHDERGNGRVEWINAPPDGERVPLSVEDDDAKHRPERGYNPYQKAPTGVGAPSTERPAKRDLRKLSEWIKQMRELEARKQRGDDGEGDGGDTDGGDRDGGDA